MSDPHRFLLHRDRAVQAGAGTGKTHALVTQYLHLCAGLSAHGRPLEPRQIAAMTFTDKAAGEMLDRMRQRIARLLRALPLGEDEVAAAEPDLHVTAQALVRPVPGPEHWERVLVQLGSAPVGTFHSFAGALLRRHPALARVDPDYLLFDQETARDMELEATERVVLSALEGGLFGASADNPPGPVSAEEAARLVAEYGFRGLGGGSEALVELLCRVRQKRAEEGLRPAGLAAPYDDAAIERGFSQARWQLIAGLRRLGELADALGDKSATTARELAGAEGRLGALLREVAAIDAVLAECEPMLAALGRLRTRVGDEGTQRALADVKGQIRKAWRDLEAVLYTGQAAPLARTFERLCAAAWAAYDEAKRRAGGLDFTDLLSRARDLLRDHAEVRGRVQERLAALLVDEFQDTNPLQAELLLLLAGAPAAQGEAPAGRLYIVGDRKQSIYEFRGADVATFASMCQGIVAAGGDEETLAVSRRSLPGVLGLVNTLFARVMQPPGGLAAGESSDVTPVTLPGASAAPGGLPGWVMKWDPARDDLVPLRTVEREGPFAELLCPDPALAQVAPEAGHEAEDPMDREADLLARHIVSLQRGGRPFGEMAVLLWRFTHLSRYLLALRQARVPYYVVKGRGFYEAQEIRDLCAALALIDDPEDTLALVSVLRSPLCAVRDDTLVRLHLQGRLRLSALLRPEPPGLQDLPPDEAERLGRIVRLLGLLHERGDRLGPAACLRAICEATDLPAVLCAGPEGEQRVANLELLIARARRFEDGGGLRAFVRWLRLLVEPSLTGESLAPAAQIVDERDDVVRVMTIHQAKGLEFPVVFVPGCAARERVDVAAISYDREVGIGLGLRRGGERRDSLPARQVRDLRRLRAEAEAMRLFYVAATRARDRVVFLGESRHAASKGTWRGHLDALLAAPEGDVLSVCHPPPLPPMEGIAGPAPSAEAETRQAEVAAAAVARAGERVRPGAAGPVRLVAAAAADLCACPRRFHLMHGLLLLERDEPGPGQAPARARAGEEDRDREDWLRHGTLAHRLLGRADLGRGGADLEGLLLADGLDPRGLAVAEIRTRVARFLQGRFLREEVAALPAGAVRRTQPFLLALPSAGEGAEVVLRGRIDLLFETAGALTLIDYHYDYGPEAPAQEGPLLRTRRALLGLLGRALRPGASAIRVGFVHLREADPTPRLIDSSPEAEQAALAEVLAAAPAATLSDGEALQLPPLPIDRCAQLGCGYRYRCHPSVS